MSLPKVSYGSYNYGAYANPKAIQYKGGLGEGLAKGLAQGIDSYFKKKASDKKEEEEAGQAGTINAQKYGAALKEHLGNATSQNKKYIKQKKKDYGDVVKQYKLGNIGEDEYMEKMDVFENILVELGGLKNSIVELNKLNNGQDIPTSELRQNGAAYDANLKGNALKRGQFLLSDGPDGVEVTLPAFVGVNNFTQLPLQQVKLSDLAQNEKIYLPDLKYNNEANKGIQDVTKKYFDNAKANADYVEFKDVGQDGTKEQSFINAAKRDEILSDIKADGEYYTKLNGNDKRIFFEDNVINPKTGKPFGIGSWNNSPEQQELLKDSLANSIADDIVGKAVSNPYNKPRENELDKYKEDAIKIRKRINDTAGQRKNIADNYEKYITFDKNNRISNYGEFKRQLQSLGITTGSEFGDDDGVHTIEIKGLGYSDTIDFRTMDSTTMSIIIENAQGAMKLNEPATGLP